MAKDDAERSFRAPPEKGALDADAAEELFTKVDGRVILTRAAPQITQTGWSCGGGR